MFTFPSCAWCCCCSLHNRCRLLANGGIEEWMTTSARITSVFSFSKSTTFSRTFQTNTQQCWHHFSDSPARCLWRKSCKYPSTRVPASFRVTSTPSWQFAVADYITTGTHTMAASQVYVSITYSRFVHPWLPTHMLASCDTWPAAFRKKLWAEAGDWGRPQWVYGGRLAARLVSVLRTKLTKTVRASELQVGWVTGQTNSASETHTGHVCWCDVTASHLWLGDVYAK